jgi:L-2,4-diaminobutyrate decarboxylase
LFESEFLTGTEASQSRYRDLIRRAVEILGSSWPQKPYSGQKPATLAEMVGSDFFLQQPSSVATIEQTLQTVVQNSIALTHPRTTAHLHCPPLLAALSAEVVITALNQSMDSFDQAPIATIIEQKLVRWLCGEMGLSITAGGSFTTGGSQSNYMGLLLSRDAFLQKQWNWSAQKSGLPPDARKLRILCSEVAHFTVEKSASQLGLGTESVVRIGADDHFRMNPRNLRDSLQSLGQQGLFPMAVVATAGTTDFGSIDPLHESIDLAHSAGAWLHIDAAYGGALLFSVQHRPKLNGIDGADSLSIDFHKLFWQPIPCSIFLLLDARHFDLIKLHADYLNPEGHEDEGIPNLVTNSLLTTRRFDALKLWISFQTLGREKLAAMIDRTVELARHAAELIRNRPELELVCEPQLSTVVFRYEPSTSDLDADKINAAIRQRLFDQGNAVIGHTRVRGRQCLKLTCMNPMTSEAELDELIQMVIKQGREVERVGGI